MALSPSAGGAKLALCQRCSRRFTERTEMMEKWQQQEVHVKESRWAEEVPQRWKQPKGKDKTEKKKRGRAAEVHLAQWSAWSTERKYMKRHKSKCDIFFGIEDRLRKEEMEEQFHKEAKEGSKFAADAARITDERAGIDDQKHT